MDQVVYGITLQLRVLWSHVSLLIKGVGLFVLLFMLAACSPATIRTYEPVYLPRPDRPTLPSVSGQALQCLSDEAYTGITLREQAVQHYADQLERIIDLNNRRALAPE